MGFDEEPYGDPHGECAKEIHELRTKIKQMAVEAVAIQVENGKFRISIDHWKRQASATDVAFLREEQDHEAMKLHNSILEKAVEYYLNTNDLQCEISTVSECRQCAICHIRIAIQGPGNCCPGYAKNCDAHSTGCVFLVTSDPVICVKCGQRIEGEHVSTDLGNYHSMACPLPKR